MAILATTVVAPAGVAPNLVAANAGGDRCECGDTVFLHVKTGATGATVTIDSVTPSNYGTDADLVVVIGTNTERFIGPLKASRFASNTDGLAAITYSQVVTVTVEPVRV